MSSYDLILRLIEMLLAEKDKNYQLRDEKMNDKDQVAYIVESGNKLQFVSAFYLLQTTMSDQFFILA